MDEETFGRPASLQKPAVWARSTTKDKIMQEHGLAHWYQHQKNIPEPWGPREWSPGALISSLPSVIQTGAGVEGPSRTMHPSGILVQLLRERPLLSLLRPEKRPEGPAKSTEGGQKAQGFHPMGRPSDPELVAISPDWEVERRRFEGRDFGGDVVALDQFGGEIPKRTAAKR